ncbi:choice-of-anchor U domain-containing protein [Verminephrobacter aporrectodeae]|uniref:choice-of-anchor U domain-containing protein n=1 Tax=Verminephrobacter aporrectodeae TaxID=1110389 RepID=UPI002238A12D|nr:choice-of-anchor U domain-containing protein [Verminephrobacter aporrectodeae]
MSDTTASTPASSPLQQNTVSDDKLNQPVGKLTLASPPEGSDAGRGSVPDAQKERTVSIPGAVTGDGIQNSAQAAAASKTVAKDGDSTAPITLVADSQDGKVSAGSNTHIVNLEQKAAANFPEGAETPIGVTDFFATVETAGDSAKFSLYLDPNTDVNGYWALNSAGVWVNLASESYGGQMTGEGEQVRLDFSIQDGGEFDADGVADGSVSFISGAAARMPLSIVGQTAESAPDAAGF